MATVSEYGVITPVSIGKTYIVIVASGGLTKTVPVEVKALVDPTKMNVAVNIYYNSAGTNGKYSSIEYGAPVEVTGDGQYTATFDLAKDLSKAGQEAGIKDINQVTAIYLQDYDVSLGNIAKSNVVDQKDKKLKIKWDKILVNDQEMTITKNGADSEGKNAMNGTKFDTGSPINGWDGSDIAETTLDTSLHAASFTVADPTKISITFTLSNVVFRDAGSKDVDATEITTETDQLQMNSGSEKEIVVNVGPADTTSKVTFVSGDESVVSVDNTAVAPVDGKASVVLEAVGEGSAVVTAYTSNGLSKSISVQVAGKADPAPTQEPGGEPAAAPSTVPSAAPDQQPEITLDKAPVVKNACKSIKARKTTVVVKKGKTATVKFTVTAANKKQAVTDKLRARIRNGKIASVVTKKTMVKKGYATVTVKGKKKGTTKLTVKLGSKSTKVTIKVK